VCLNNEKGPCITGKCHKKFGALFLSGSTVSWPPKIPGDTVSRARPRTWLHRFLSATLKGGGGGGGEGRGGGGGGARGGGVTGASRGGDRRHPRG